MPDSEVVGKKTQMITEKISPRTLLNNINLLDRLLLICKVTEIQITVYSLVFVQHFLALKVFFYETLLIRNWNNTH